MISRLDLLLQDKQQGGEISALRDQIDAAIYNRRKRKKLQAKYQRLITNKLREENGLEKPRYRVPARKRMN
jgi:hypothetical protein